MPLYIPSNTEYKNLGGINFPLPSSSFLSCSHVYKNLLFICTNTGAMYKITSSRNWAKIDTGLGTANIVAMSSVGNRLVIMRNTGATYYSDDLGNSWTPSSVPPPILIPSLATSGNRIVGVTAGRQSYSTTDGDVWTVGGLIFPTNAAFGSGSRVLTYSDKHKVFIALCFWQTAVGAGNAIENYVCYSPDSSSWVNNPVQNRGAFQAAYEMDGVMYVVGGYTSSITPSGGNDSGGWILSSGDLFNSFTAIPGIFSTSFYNRGVPSIPTAYWTVKNIVGYKSRLYVSTLQGPFVIVERGVSTILPGGSEDGASSITTGVGEVFLDAVWLNHKALFTTLFK